MKNIFEDCTNYEFLIMNQILVNSVSFTIEQEIYFKRDKCINNVGK